MNHSVGLAVLLINTLFLSLVNLRPHLCFAPGQADEAIESAVEEFEIQGYTLEGIIKAVGGAEALAR